MGSLKKLLDRVLSARSDANMRLDDLQAVLAALAFEERAKGSHHIFTRAGVVEIINLQPLPGGKAKSYQVKQVPEIITRYGLGFPE